MLTAHISITSDGTSQQSNPSQPPIDVSWDKAKASSQPSAAAHATPGLSAAATAGGSTFGKELDDRSKSGATSRAPHEHETKSKKPQEEVILEGLKLPQGEYKADEVFANFLKEQDRKKALKREREEKERAQREARSKSRDRDRSRSRDQGRSNSRSRSRSNDRDGYRRGSRDRAGDFRSTGSRTGTDRSRERADSDSKDPVERGSTAKDKPGRDRDRKSSRDTNVESGGERDARRSKSRTPSSRRARSSSRDRNYDRSRGRSRDAPYSRDRDYDRGRREGGEKSREYDSRDRGRERDDRSDRDYYTRDRDRYDARGRDRDKDCDRSRDAREARDSPRDYHDSRAFGREGGSWNQRSDRTAQVCLPTLSSKHVALRLQHKIISFCQIRLRIQIAGRGPEVGVAVTSGRRIRSLVKMIGSVGRTTCTRRTNKPTLVRNVNSNHNHLLMSLDYQ